MVAIMVDFENFSSIFILLCLFSFVCYFLFFKKPKESRLGFELAPSPPSLPIIGHLHLFHSGLLHKSLQKLSLKYGPVLHLHFFSFPILLVSSASIAYEIFTTHDVSVSSRRGSTIDGSLVYGTSGYSGAPYDNYSKFMKKLITTELLGPQAMERSRSNRSEELQRFCLILLGKARKKESIEIGKAAIKLANNIICRMSMGRSCYEGNGEAERVRELVTKFIALTKKLLLANVMSGPLKKLVILLFRKEIMGLSHGFDELLERLLVEHEKKLERHQDRDMMDLLLEAYQNEEAEYKITRNQIKSLSVEIFVGGTDTSALVTQWTMAEILSNPKVLEKLREEIDCFVGKTRLVQETDLPNLPYLQAVVKEGLRLHPPGPFVFREFTESCKINEFYVPKKTTLVVNSYAVMRSPDSWEDPDMFKPERFLASSRSPQEEVIREQVMKYLPFGGGRRSCPASKLAYNFIGTTVGAMVQCFDWRIIGEKISMEEAVEGLVMTMAHPLKCTPIVRLDPSSF